MKRKIAYISLVFLLITGCKSNDKKVDALKSFAIHGTVAATNSKIIYLLDSQQRKLDSAKISKNSFLLSGVSNSPQICYLRLKNHEKTHALILENARYTLLINNDKASTIGGLLNMKLQKYRNLKTKLNLKKLTLIDSFANGEVNSDQLYNALQSFHKERKMLTSDYIVSNSDNIVAHYLFLHTKSFSLSEFKVLKNRINIQGNKQLDSLLARDISKLQAIAAQKLTEKQKKAAVKKTNRRPAILFTGDGINGELVSLSSILKGKKVVLIDFWASWCGPCRMATPSIRRLYNTYKNKGFDILTVSEDKDTASWKKGLQDDNMLSWHHIFDDYGRISSIYNVRAIPYMVLIDGDGGIIQEKISISALEKQLKNILD